MKMDFVSSNITSWGRADIIRLNMIPLCYYKFVELFNCNDITQFIYNFLTIEHARLVHITIFCSTFGPLNKFDVLRVSCVTKTFYVVVVLLTFDSIFFLVHT